MKTYRAEKPRGICVIDDLRLSIVECMPGDGAPHEYHVYAVHERRLTPDDGIAYFPTPSDLEELVRARPPVDSTDRAAALEAALRHAVTELASHRGESPPCSAWAGRQVEQLAAELTA